MRQWLPGLVVGLAWVKMPVMPSLGVRVRQHYHHIKKGYGRRLKRFELLPLRYTSLWEWKKGRLS